MSVYYRDGNGTYRKGITLYSRDGNGGYFPIDNMDWIYLSGKAILQNSGEIEIPGERGLGFELAGSLLSRGEPPYFLHLIDELGWNYRFSRKYGVDTTEKNINLTNSIKGILENVRFVSEYLVMPKMLEYEQDIIQACMKIYLRDYVKPKFSSGKLRGKKTFETELKSLLNELGKMADYLGCIKTNLFRLKVEETARKAKVGGSSERKLKREKRSNKKLRNI